MSRYSPGFLASGQGNDQYTKILLHLDGNLTDSNLGGSAHTWTAHGSSFVTSGQKFGTGAIQCPYADTPANADFVLGSGDWTIDFWFDTLAAGNGTSRNLAGQNSAAFTFAATSFFIQLNSANKVTANTCNGAAFFTVNGTTAIATAGLHYFEFVRTGNILRMFLDGVQEGGDVAITGTVPTSASALSVGRSGAYTNETFNGLIDEFRLSVGIARNTANFTPPTTPYGP